jgi:hypothetical protein
MLKRLLSINESALAAELSELLEESQIEFELTATDRCTKTVTHFGAHRFSKWATNRLRPSKKEKSMSLV